MTMDSELTSAIVLWTLRTVYAGIILGVGLWLAFFVSGHVKRQAVKHPLIDTTVGSFLALLIRYSIIVFVVIAVLQRFGVQTASLAAVIGAAALAIGLALQGTLGNVASGILIAVLRPYRIDDFVEINGHEGTVIDLDIFFTEIETLDDRRILVPNGEALSNSIVNYCRQGRRRCVMDFGVSYEDDIDHVFNVMRNVVRADPRTMSNPPPWFGVEGLGDSSVNVTARAWIKPEDYLQYRSDMIQRIKEAFDREGVEIPYPHAVEISKGEIQLRMPPIKPDPFARALESGDGGPG
jgi:small conductance mechanosensitive channel